MTFQKAATASNVFDFSQRANRAATRNPSDFAPWLRSEGAARYPVFKNNVVFFPVHLTRPPGIQNE